MDSLFAIFDTMELDGMRRLLPDSANSVMNGYETPDPQGLIWVVVVATLCMVYMAWGIGANDVANSFATAFGAKCLTARQACCIAAVCELAGAVLLGASVSDTIRKGMMSISLYGGDDGRVLVMAGMTSVLLAAASWLLAASKLGLPVSTTHSAVGGVVAFSVASKGYDSVKWDKVGMIVASWFNSPTMAGVSGFTTYFILKKLVVMQENSRHRAKIAMPIMVFILSFTVMLFTIYKGAKGIGLNKTSPLVSVLCSACVSMVAALLSYPIMIRHVKRLEEQDAAEASKTEEGKEGTPPAATEISDQPEKPRKAVSDPKTESMFRALVVVCAAFQSIAHGANDVANSVGPFAAVMAAREGELGKKTEIKIWVFFLAGGFIIIGLATYGMKVMRTIGENITEVTPSKACCAQFSATLVVLLATRLGLPISTTHAAVGGVLGVGLADGVNAINWKVMAKIFGSWIITLPICGITAAGIYGLFLPLVLVV